MKQVLGLEAFEKECLEKSRSTILEERWLCR